MHYYKFNISDYKAHTEHLELLEDLAFRRMLDWMYLHEKPLPKNIDEIARFIRMRSHNDCIAYVLQEFFIKTKDGFINERVGKELGNFQKKSAMAKKSADARWKKNNNKNNDLANANASKTQCDDNANGMLNTKHKTLNTKQETITKEKDSSNDGEIKFLSDITEYWNCIMTTQPKVNLLDKTKATETRVRAIKKIIKDYPHYSDSEYFQGYFYRLSTMEDFDWQRKNKQVTFDQATNLTKFARNIEIMRMVEA